VNVKSGRGTKMKKEKVIQMKSSASVAADVINSSGEKKKIVNSNYDCHKCSKNALIRGNKF